MVSQPTIYVISTVLALAGSIADAAGLVAWLTTLPVLT